MLVLIASDPDSRKTAKELAGEFSILTVTDIPVTALPGETVLPHENKGRGLRLKRAFAYAFGEMGADGVITLPRGGCDPAYVLRVADALKAGDRFVDGGLHTASPAKMGGVIRLLTTFTTGSHRVPWCGLRGYAKEIAPLLQKVGGRHDDYEITLLQAANNEGIAITDLACDKKEDGGAAQPAVTVKNGTRAMWGIFRNASSLKFMASSALAFAIDFVLFWILAECLSIEQDELRNSTAQVISWLVSSQVNFYVNQFLVFHKKDGIIKAMAQYYSLAVFVMLGKLGGLLALGFLPVILAKIICEASFFLINYFVQKKLIFKKKKVLSEESTPQN